jgi:hypothetical protein
MTEQNNAREFSRIEIPMTATLSVDGEKTVSCKVVNISLNGIELCTEHNMSLGDRCQVEVQIGNPDDTLSIFAEGKVARITSDGLAVNFESIGLESYDHLKNMITYNAGNIDQVEKEFSEHLGLHRK